MICPVCKEKGLTSKIKCIHITSVYVGKASKYDYDENGKSIPSTLNLRWVNLYECSNGHQFKILEKLPENNLPEECIIIKS